MASTRTPSQGRTIQPKAILELGKKAISAMRDGSPDSIELLEEYVTGFASWEATWSVAKGGAKELPVKERELGRRIAFQHAQVVRLAEELRASMDESLKMLRVKGKGLKAYIDQLPQRISTIRTRKG